MPSRPRPWAWPAAFAATASLLAAVAVSLFREYLPRADLDHGLHVRFAQRLLVEGLLLPHFVYHLLVAAVALGSSDLARLTAAAEAVLVLLVLAKLALALLFLRWLLRSAGRELRPGPALALMVAFFFVAPLPKWWRTENVYLGQLSPTVWHNPTAITALPLAIATFWLFVRKPGARSLTAAVAATDDPPGGEREASRLDGRLIQVAGLGLAVQRRSDLWAGLLLAATTAAKPNFALAFAPAALLLRLRRLDPLGLLALLAPAGCVLVWQYVHALTSGLANGGLTELQPFEVWGIYSPHPLVSTLVSLAFPLAVLAGGVRHPVLRTPLAAAWLVTLVATAQFALLAEPEPRLGDANYYWGVVPSVFLLFLVSAAELLARPAWSPGARRWRAVCWLLLALHAASGVVLVARPFQLAVVD